MPEGTISRCAFLGSLCILTQASSLVVLNAIGFCLGRPVSGTSFVFSVFVAVLATLFAARTGPAPLPWNLALLTLALVLAFGVASVLLSDSFYDFSGDGQYYHQQAIIELRQGWNPVYESPSRSSAETWVRHYPKGAWSYAASLYRLTHRIEQGKCLNWLLMAASFGLALEALRRAALAGRAWALSIAGIAALNPISLCQTLSFHVDGQLSSLLVSLLALSSGLVTASDPWRVLMSGMIAVLAVNLKFTAIPSVLAFLGAVAAALALRGEWHRLWRLSLAWVASLVVGLALVGYSPYVRNWRDHGHPFYPLAGAEPTIDFMTGASPAGFPEMGRVEKLFLSIASRTENTQAPDAVRPKWPFTFDRDELRALADPDTRVAALGPFFSGALLLALVLLGARARTDSRDVRWTLFVILILLGSSLVTPHPWWFRYVPQLFLIPLVALVGTASVAGPLRLCRYALLLTLLLNLGLVAVSYAYWQQLTNSVVRSTLEQLRPCAPIAIQFGAYRTPAVRLAEMGLDFREIPEDAPLPCSPSLRLWAVEGEICPASCE